MTAEVLERSTNNQWTPYQWLVEQLPSQGPVLDVACGDAPLAAMLGARWIGIDRSPSELASALARVDDGRMVRGEASALPFRSNSVGVAACSMALQILDPLDAVMTELRRIVCTGSSCWRSMREPANRGRATLRPRRFDGGDDEINRWSWSLR